MWEGNYPKQKPVASLPDRVDGWLRTRNYVAAGNLGEQIAIRSMKSLGYDLLGGQDDFLGMVSEVLGDTTQDKPEDMIAIDPGGRLVTVNTKASLSARSCLIRGDGNLSFPRMSTAQRSVAYSTRRASLVSPLGGDSFAQIIKVDLRNLLAQVFEIDEGGRVQTSSVVLDVADIAAQSCSNIPSTCLLPESGNSRIRVDSAQARRFSK